MALCRNGLIMINVASCLSVSVTLAEVAGTVRDEWGSGHEELGGLVGNASLEPCRISTSEDKFKNAGVEEGTDSSEAVN